MSDDLRAAAERTVAWYEGMARHGGVWDELADGIVSVARAYLAEHPADDGEPADLNPRYLPGPVPDGFYGLILAVLDPGLFGPDRPEPWDEYHGDPVVIDWCGHKGQTTFGVRTIPADGVLRWAVLTADREQIARAAGLYCPDCGSPGVWRSGVHFDHELLCTRAGCSQTWEPGQPADGRADR